MSELVLWFDAAAVLCIGIIAIILVVYVLVVALAYAAASVFLVMVYGARAAEFMAKIASRVSDYDG